MPVRLSPVQFVLALAALLVSGFLWHWVTTPLVISVSGTGSVSVFAEKAVFTVTISEVQDDLTFAASQVRQRVVTLRSLLENEGIGGDAVSESQMQITPAGALVAGLPGYQAAITLNVETTDVASVGDLVVFLYQNGATVVSQPVIVAENQSELENDALKEALTQASDNAAALGRKKLKFFRRAVSISQATSGQAATSTKEEAVSDAEGTLTTANTFEITRGVNVVYEMW